MEDFVHKYIFNGPVGVILGLVLGIWYMIKTPPPEEFH